VNPESIKHLDEAQILGALIGEDTLAPEVLQHLSFCDSCLNEKKRLQRNLRRMGHLARSLSPSPAELFSLEEARASRRPAWNWWQGAAAGLVFACLIAVFIGSFMPRSPRDNNKAVMFSQEMLADDEFIKDIDTLERDPLPPLYADIAESLDSDPGDEAPAKTAPAHVPDPDNLS
jgi:hypothetical protein